MSTTPPSWFHPTTGRPFFLTVAALVKGECSGYRPSGGVRSPHYCCEPPIDGPCYLLCPKPRPCQLFERRLLAIAPQAVVRDYAEMFGTRKAAVAASERLGGELSDRECPGCGRPLAKRQRRCGTCLKALRKETYRRANANRRNATAGVQQFPPGDAVKPLVSPASLRGSV